MISNPSLKLEKKSNSLLLGSLYSSSFVFSNRNNGKNQGWKKRNPSLYGDFTHPILTFNMNWKNIFNFFYFKIQDLIAINLPKKVARKI